MQRLSVSVVSGGSMAERSLRVLAAAAALLAGCHSGAPGGGEPGGPTDVVALAPMSVARAVHTEVPLHDGRVLIAGGFDDAGHTHATTELYDPTTRRFVPGASMATARVDHTATVLDDGRVLIVGGFAGDALASAELYDPASDAFASAGRLRTARNGHNAVRLGDGRILIVGGDGPGGTFLASAEIFDPRTGEFTLTGSMAVARSSHTATLVPDGRVLVTGGHVGHQAELQIHATAELYDPVRGTFSPTGSMSRVRHKHDAAPLPDGRVLIVGGADARDDRGAYDSAEAYDPDSGTFSPAGQMLWQRYKIQATTVPLFNGQLLLAGGALEAELYDPSGGVFERVSGDFGDRPLFAAASLLVDGSVLITGGYGLHSYARANAWIYTIRP
jgi:hypothetical protein